ncbi:MAG: sigma 54-interacting transcriptional regulator [Myxococcota bacterium]
MAARAERTSAGRERRVVMPGSLGPAPELVEMKTPWRAERAVALRVHRDQMPPALLMLREERYVLGRHDAADVVFESGAVSRLHAVLRSEEGRWFFQDYDSRNGSTLRRPGADVAVPLPAHKPVELFVGDVVELGTPEARLEVVGASALPTSEDPTEDAALISPVSRAFAARIELAARTRVPVFLLGPSGSGKTHTARQIHLKSQGTGPFVPINCARLPQDPAALHSELLGHVRGAFTGAESSRTGKFIQADGGTLFLDEVESLHPLAQGFLLDVLEGSGDLSPLGSRTPVVRAPIFRLVSASKRPLAQSGLRADLCERLAEGHMWKMPTLDERREDIPGLVTVFVNEQSRMLGVPIVITDEAVAAAVDAPWPGQIRQLRAMIMALSQIALAENAGAPAPQRRLVLRRSDVERHLRERDEAFGAGRDPMVEMLRAEAGNLLRKTPTQTLVEVTNPRVIPAKLKADARALTEEQVRAILAETNFNQSEAARRLGIARNTLAAKMKQFSIDTPEQ